MSELVPINFEIRSDDFGEYKWFDANNDGVLELFITTTSGRRFFNDLWIFSATSGHKEFMQHEDVWMLDKLDPAFKDFENDGVYELVVPIHLVSDGGLARPMAIWSAIYRWNGNKFERADQRYEEFYIEKLPELESQIKAIEEELAIGDEDYNRDQWVKESKQNNQHHLACVTIIRDKILRTTGRDPNAGFQKAFEWSHRDDEQMRRYAVFVFQDIFDKESRKQLEVMMKDSNESVAMHARVALENKLKSQKK